MTLYAICPHDGSRLETGITADLQTALQLRDEKVLVRCDHCDTYHPMRIGDLRAESQAEPAAA